MFSTANALSGKFNPKTQNCLTLLRLCLTHIPILFPILTEPYLVYAFPENFMMFCLSTLRSLDMFSSNKVYAFFQQSEVVLSVLVRVVLLLL